MRLIDADALLEELPIHPDGGLRTVKEECLMIRVRETVKASPTVGGWISVKDRLPEDGQTVVAYVKLGRYMDITVFYKAKGVWDTPDGWYGIDRISHWMPLPEPPEEVSGDEG